MKQRNRIKCIKTRTCGYYIRLDRIRRAWARVPLTGRSLSRAMREAYAKGREELT